LNLEKDEHRLMQYLYDLNMMQKLALGVLLLCSLITFSASTLAGTTSAPLVMTLENGQYAQPGGGDIWAWYGSNKPLKRLTSYGYNDGAVLNPDGSTVAYRSYPQFVVDAYKKGLSFSGGNPSNIWIMNLANQKAVRIADQPSKLPSDGAWIQRSSLSWSLDGKLLAWMELVQGGGYRLAIYTLKTGKTVVVNLNAPSELRTPLWGSFGIVVSLYDSQDRVISAVFSPTGQKLHEWAFNSFNATIAEVSAKQYLRTSEEEGLFGPISGKTFAKPKNLAWVNVSAGKNANIFCYSTSSASECYVKGNSNPVLILSNASLAVSPEGQRLAYEANNVLSVFSNGKADKIDTGALQILDFDWGPNIWKVQAKP
jgi:hypothetical protein